MQQLNRNLYLLIAILFATGVTIFTLSHIVTEPWHMLPEIGRDGAKNNFTYLYQSMFGHGYWFDGMNYPYGEHIVYTDGEPLLSVFLSSFKNITSGEALTVLWLLMGLCYILAVFFTYRILAWFHVSHIPAMVFAGLIVICAPQILCLEGHYALGYTCVMPMLFYWTIMYHQRPHWWYCVYVFFLGMVMAFLHPYYIAMVLVWLLGYSLGYFIFIKQDISKKIRQVLPLLSSAVLVFLLVALVMKLTDPVTDRPQTPFNEKGMYTTLSHILSSAYSPLWKLAIAMHIVPRASSGGEGFVYIGCVTATTVFISLLLYINRKLRKKQDKVAEPGNFSPIWLFSGFIALILSMGIPFIWHMEWLMDYLSVFKQFRTLGRFSWIFYYVVTIYSVVVIYSWFTNLLKNGKVLYGYLMLLLSMGIWSYEASGYVKFSRQLSLNGMYNYGLIYSKYEKNWETFLSEKHFKGDDFQAIILLPFVHVGTEKIWVGDPGWLFTMGTRPALQLHLPIVDVLMSRSSWSVAQRQVKLIGGPFTDKSILRDVKSNKPFLLFTLDLDQTALDQHYLLDASDFLGDFSGGKVYAFYPDRLAANDKKYADSVNRVLAYMVSADTCIAGKGTCYIDHMDAGTAADHLFGKGAAPATRLDKSQLATIPVKPLNDSVLYEFSSWFLLRKEDCRSPYLNLQCIDGDGKVIRSTDVITRWSVDSHDLWFRASAYFYIPAGCCNVRCTLYNTPDPAYKAMDEIQLRPADALIISKAWDGRIMANNHLFKIVKQ